jgi:hypothetical protein
VAQSRSQWLVLVNTIINIFESLNVKNFARSPFVIVSTDFVSFIFHLLIKTLV